MSSSNSLDDFFCMKISHLLGRAGQVGVMIRICPSWGRIIKGNSLFQAHCVVHLAVRMGWTIRTWVRLALLLALGFVNFGVLARQKRQSDWWRSHQRVAPGQDFSRGSLRKPNWGGLDPLYGFGASSGGSLGGHAGGRLGDLPQTGRSPISVQCGEDSMTISVRRDFYKNGRLVKPSDLSLGSQGCKPSAPSTDPIIFQVGLQDCGNVLQVNLSGKCQ